MSFLTGQRWFCLDDGTHGYSAVTQWAALTVTAPGTLRRPLTTPAVGSERVYVATQSSSLTTGASEPTWPTTQGASVTDGTVTWQDVTGKSGVNGDLSETANWTTVKNTSVSKGVLIQRNSGGSLQLCTVAGTAGNGSEPSFSDTAGVTTTDGTVTWVSLGAPNNFGSFAAPMARLNLVCAASPFAQANDVCYFDKTHAETQASSMAYTAIPSGVLLLCIDKTSGVNPPTAPSTGGSCTTTGANNMSFGLGTNTNICKIVGLTMNVGTGSSIATLTLNNAGTIFTENCTINIAHTATGTVILNNANVANSYAQGHNGLTVTFGATGQTMTSPITKCNFRSCTFAATGSVPTQLFTGIGPAGSQGLTRLIGCDLSAITGTLGGICTSYENCKFGSSVTLSAAIASSGAFVRAHNCDNGATNYKYNYIAFGGSTVQETTIVRTGGATDNTTPISWNMTSLSTSLFNFPFVSEEIVEWNDATGSSKTATLYLTTNATLNNNDFWADLEYLGDSGDPKSTTVTSRMAYLGTPTQLTTDSSTWGGSALTKLYSIALTFTPQQKGPVKVRFHLAKPSVTVYVDPLITIA